MEQISKETKLRDVVDSCFKKIKQEFYQTYKFEEFEADNTPFLLTMRDVVESLPPKIKAIEIKRKQAESPEIGFLISYDYSESKSKSIEYCGVIESDSEEITKFVATKFNMDEKSISWIIKDVCGDFNPTTTWDDSEGYHVQLVPGNMLENPEMFYDEWKKMVLYIREVPILTKKFQRERFEDFNELYGLKPDPILSSEELIQSDGANHFLNLNIQTVQQHVSKLQLIPAVPDEIKKIIKRVKELYIFGYFRYDFFTIAQHYAFLALDIAIKTRYIMSLNKPVVLTDLRKNELRHEMKNPTYYDIGAFAWETKGWNVHSLLVNGELFAYNSKKLLDWLEKDHLIRKWEKGIYDAGLSLRNYFSHPEKPSTLIPNSKILQTVVNEINYMFHK